MFIDASALVAIVKQEPESHALLKAIDACKGKIWVSPIVRFEAVISIAAQLARNEGRGEIIEEDRAHAEAWVADLVKEIGAVEMHISESIGVGARSAAMAYGKVAGHAAQLSMADCFSYACAKAYHTPLLYAGDGFAQTDLA